MFSNTVRFRQGRLLLRRTHPHQERRDAGGGFQRRLSELGLLPGVRRAQHRAILGGGVDRHRRRYRRRSKCAVTRAPVPSPTVLYRPLFAKSSSSGSSRYLSLILFFSSHFRFTCAFPFPFFRCCLLFPSPHLFGISFPRPPLPYPPPFTPLLSRMQPCTLLVLSIHSSIYGLE